MNFPHIASGDRITRAWFNRLIDYCNSLSLSGDGRTTRVSHGSAGTVVSAVPQSAEAEGGGWSGTAFRVTPNRQSATVTVAPGIVRVIPHGIARANQRYAVASIPEKTIPASPGRRLVLVGLRSHIAPYDISQFCYVWMSGADDAAIPRLPGVECAVIGRLRAASGGKWIFDQYQRGDVVMHTHDTPDTFLCRCTAPVDGDVLEDLRLPVEAIIFAGRIYAARFDVTYQSNPGTGTWYSVSNVSDGTKLTASAIAARGAGTFYIALRGLSYYTPDMQIYDAASPLYVCDLDSNPDKLTRPVAMYTATLSGGTVKVTDVKQLGVGIGYMAQFYEE